MQKGLATSTGPAFPKNPAANLLAAKSWVPLLAAFRGVVYSSGLSWGSGAVVERGPGKALGEEARSKREKGRSNKSVFSTHGARVQEPGRGDVARSKAQHGMDGWMDG